MPFFKIEANVNEAYDSNAKLIDKKERNKLGVITFDIFSENKVNAIGLAAAKLGAEGYSHESIRIIK